LPALEWFFLFIEFPLRNKYLVLFKFRIEDICLDTNTHSWFKLEVNKIFSVVNISIEFTRITACFFWYGNLERVLEFLGSKFK
jgi:hypothetical protein